MEAFLSLPEADRRAVFVQTAAKMGRIDPSAVPFHDPLGNGKPQTAAGYP